MYREREDLGSTLPLAEPGPPFPLSRTRQRRVRNDCRLVSLYDERLAGAVFVVPHGILIYAMEGRTPTAAAVNHSILLPSRIMETHSGELGLSPSPQTDANAAGTIYASVLD